MSRPQRSGCPSTLAESRYNTASIESHPAIRNAMFLTLSMRTLTLMLLAIPAGIVTAADKLPPAGTRPVPVRVESGEDQLDIFIANHRFCRYVFRDKQISRPYFAHLCTPSGTQVTRRHPPVEGEDATDHASYHPGLWTGFGDISGHDYWRLKAAVKHVKFLEAPRAGPGWASFTAANDYLAVDRTTTVCQERFTFVVLVRETGYLVLWESVFLAAGKEVVFGDQEEMGLGVRVATPLAVDNGGRIVDSMGRVDGKGIWGRQSNWCDYHGRIGKHLVGVTLMPHPDNFRPSWFHARDYGLVVANPFGRNAFTKQEKSRFVVPVKQPLRLRFAIHLHSQPHSVGAVLPTAEQMGRQRERAYQDYLKILHSGGGVR